MYTPIRDYALIGNRRSSILISKEGAIDWAPAPYIDSPSVFAALLDDEKGGTWWIRPQGEYETTQRYIEDTNIVECTFTTHRGVMTVTDYIPLELERHYIPREEDTTFKIKRRVACTQGVVDVEMFFQPRFNYAQGETKLREEPWGVGCVLDGHQGILVSSERCRVDTRTNQASALFQLQEGEVEYFVFRYNVGEVDLLKDNHQHHEEELQTTIAVHQEWTNKCETDECELPERWQGHIVRSKLVLKNLFFEPVGTIAAAATTSLPEWVGGIRNWDYRYTWLRDSAFLLDAFFKLGHVTEAQNYVNWVVNMCSIGSPEELKIMYGLRGEMDLTEEILPHLSGYRNSQPVRIGNGAHDQEQWDIYGSVLQVVHRLQELTGEPPSVPRWEVMRRLADHVCSIWEKPDEGLWEVRGGKRRFTYSAVMNWVALDRALRLSDQYHLEGDRELWREHRRRIKACIMDEAWSEDKQAFAQSFGSDELDAAILLMPILGFIKGDDPKMVATIEAIERELVCGDEGAFVKRYSSPDGLPGEEGAFLLSSFWYVDALYLSGQKEKAIKVFETLLSYANHVGLFSEEIHPETKEFLGNFPQAYTHIGLINSALLLSGKRNGH